MRRLPIVLIAGILLLPAGSSHAAGFVRGGIARLSDASNSVVVVARQGAGAGSSAGNLNYLCVERRNTRLHRKETACGEVPPMRIAPDLSAASVVAVLKAAVYDERKHRSAGTSALWVEVKWEAIGSLAGYDHANACIEPVGGTSAITTYRQRAARAVVYLRSSALGNATLAGTTAPVIFQMLDLSAAVPAGIPATVRQCLQVA